ncbi:MAG: hypothetical protein KBC17_02360 [Candidatus Pacebacteria bacterium]|nr:hypothetical protein [Candidatus Paceibacterota bacterium]
MNFEEDEFKDPDEVELSSAVLDEGLDDELFEDDADIIEPDLIGAVAEEETPEEEL